MAGSLSVSSAIRWSAIYGFRKRFRFTATIVGRFVIGKLLYLIVGKQEILEDSFRLTATIIGRFVISKLLYPAVNNPWTREKIVGSLRR